MKKLIVKALLCCVMISLLCSCYDTKVIPLEAEYNQQWKNATKNEIIRQNGAPNRIIDLDNEEYIIVYENYKLNTSTSEVSTNYSFANVNGNSTTNAYGSGNANIRTYGNNTYLNGNSSATINSSGKISAYGNNTTYSNTTSSTSEKRNYTEFFMDKNNKCYLVRTSDVYTESKLNGGKTAGAVIGSIGGFALYLVLLFSLVK